MEDHAERSAFSGEKSTLFQARGLALLIIKIIAAGYYQELLVPIKPDKPTISQMQNALNS